MLNKEIVSNIINNLRFLNKDEHISRRFILNTAKAEATTLISQKLLDRTVFREDNLFKTIKCLEMEKVDVIKCGIYEFKKCSNLVKSKKKLPKMLYSRYGNSIIEVTTIDEDNPVVFFPITLSDYKLSKTRMTTKKGKSKKYYYVLDGYLYLPDCEYEVVDITLITLDLKTVEELSSCLDCDNCKSMWEYEFICPDKLLKPVLDQTLQKISVIRQFQIDELPNLDSNQKTTGQK